MQLQINEVNTLCRKIQRLKKSITAALLECNPISLLRNKSHNILCIQEYTPEMQSLRGHSSYIRCIPAREKRREVSLKWGIPDFKISSYLPYNHPKPILIYHQKLGTRGSILRGDCKFCKVLEMIPQQYTYKSGRELR